MGSFRVSFVSLLIGFAGAISPEARAEPCTASIRWAPQESATTPKLFTTLVKAPKNVTSAEGCKKLEDYTEYQGTCASVSEDHKYLVGKASQHGFALSGGQCAFCSAFDGLIVSYDKRAKKCKYDCTFSDCKVASPAPRDLLPTETTSEEPAEEVPNPKPTGHPAP